MLLIDMQYLAPVAYYVLILQYDKVLIEREENFVKAGFRNRCYIAGPNGPLRLSVPLEKGKHQHSKYKEVKIFDDEHWKKVHWQSFVSCYRNSPYFEYYEDRFEPLYANPPARLFELNLELMKLVLNLLKVEVEIQFTQGYQEQYDESKIIDLRSALNPNAAKDTVSQKITLPVYRQVFEEKTGFIPNLSIVDLLFNQGPHAAELLHS